MEINEFSRAIREAWVDKYSNSSAPTDGEILNLAKSTGGDIEYCLKTLAVLTDNVKTKFSIFMKYCKQDIKVNPKYQEDFYIDPSSGKRCKLYRENGRQVYFVPVATTKFKQMTERGFQLDPTFMIEEGEERAELYRKLEKQFDYLFKSGQIDERDYERGMVGIEILKGNTKIDLYFDKLESELAEVPF